MSSVVKKGTHFTPKLKKVTKRKITRAKSGSPLTPPATQMAPEQKPDITNEELFQQQSATPIIDTQEQPEQDHQPTSQNTQDVTKKPAFRITLDSTSTPSEKEPEEEVVDPKDATKKLENPPHEDAIKVDTSAQDESLKLPLPTASRTRRRSSTFNQRRLSGIKEPGLRSRSGSFSVVKTDVEELIPARIGIPVGKPIKRRRSSAASRSGAGLKRISIASLVSSTVSTKEQTPMIEEETDADKAEKNKKMVSAEFVVGLDPKTNRLRKFRRKGTTPKVEETEDVIKIKEEEIPEEPDDLITTISNIHQLPRKAVDEDVELYGEVEFNAEEMTMADLCKPTLPIGKVSGNFQLVKEAKATLREKRDLRRKDRELAKIRRVPVEEAKKMNIKARKEEAEKRGETIEDVAESDSKKELEKKSLFDEDAPKVSSNLQLQLTDGKIVFDEESAIIVKPRADIAGRSIEHSNPFANPITSTTYSKRVVTDKWEASEVITFYQALSMFGTDFSLIAQLFPYRTRKQVKSKFTLEERKHPEVVSVALKRKLPVDFEKYCQNINTKIETLDYYNEELKKVRHEHEQSLNAIAVERDRALREDAEASRRREIEIRTGAKPMTRAEKLKELRKNEMVVGSIDDVKKQREGEEVSK